ncbi:threonylcarbamoyl-AMP synthase [Striga asiatica]|uniref:Threonylcarbamoyl-AMP synthase n=1 Tax=Striga asiatica TaxID=4170 RepID=A0A5A7QR08_STRAF|nr:threonylcarbamoyl-AMP synthase [Striga asiatica]
MAVELKRLGGADAAPFQLRRSLNPRVGRLSFQSPPNAPRRLITLAVVKRNPKRLKYATPRFPKEDGLLKVEVDPSGSDSWKLDPVIELLKEGAVGVIPTDTVYAIVCDLRNNSAVERLRRIKDVEPSKASCKIILCRSFKDIDTYTTGFPRGNDQGLKNIFRAVKQCLPGPDYVFMYLLCLCEIIETKLLLSQYTFILTTSKEFPKHCIRYGTTTSKYASRKNVGIRMPDDAVCKAILEKMDAPLISTSVKSPKEDEWILDPVVIADVYGPEGLDFVVAAGNRFADPSTVVDMTGSSPRVIRQGKGPKQPWMDADDEEDFHVNED